MFTSQIDADCYTSWIKDHLVNHKAASSVVSDIFAWFLEYLILPKENQNSNLMSYTHVLISVNVEIQLSNQSQSESDNDQNGSLQEVQKFGLRKSGIH